MKPRKNRFILSAASALLFAPAASLLVSSTAFAGNTWDGGGSAAAGLWNWSDDLNWNLNTGPSYGTVLTFAGSNGLASNNDEATSIAGITFSSGAGAFTLSGNSVTLGGNITNNSASLQTINLPLVLDANRTINTTSGNITLGGQISGAYTLIKSAENTLTMNTAGSSFSRLQINTGTVKLGINDALPTTGGVTFATTTTAILDLNGKTQTLGGTIIIGGGGSPTPSGLGTVTISDTAGGGLLKLGGDLVQNSAGSATVNISAALDLNGATRSFNANNTSGVITVSGAISNSTGTAGLTKGGGGTLTLTGGTANTFNGAINVNQGRLNVLDGLSLTNTVGTITVASGAAFNYSKNFASGNNLSNPLNLSGAGDGSIGALNLQGNVVVTGGITLAADATITHDFNNATIQTGAITGSGRNLQLTTTQGSQPGLVVSSAIQTGAGRVSVTGAANSGAYSVQLGGNNTFTGGLVINNGVVQLNSAGALNSTAGSENAVTFGASTTTGKLALNGRSYTISNLTSNETPGSPVVENGNATAVTLTVGNSQNLSGTYAGVLQDGTGGGALSLSKDGTGTLTLSGVNTYTGATTVTTGTLVVDGSTAAGSAVSVASGGTLGGTGTIGGTLALTGKLAPGAAGVVDIETLNAGTTTWNGGSIWNFDLSSSDDTSDKLVITGNLTKGTGTLGTDYVFNFMGSQPVWNTTYTLATFASAIGFADGLNFTATNLGAGSYSTSFFTLNSNSLTFTAVPEPTTALAGLLLTAGLLRRRRR